MSMDPIARGLARLTARQIASTAAGEGAALVGFRPAAATAVARSAQDRLRDAVSVKDFGAIGNGTTDDTAAIQAAITATITASGGALYFPDGTYKITSKLVIPLSYGWRIHGQSRVGTVIKQFTGNTRIFSLESDLTHSWEISELGFSWSAQQTSAQTQSIAVFMGTGSATGNGFFNWQVRRCIFGNGFRSIAADQANSPSIWGFKVSECSHGASMSGAFVYASPTPSVGQPSITIDKCSIDAGGASEPTVVISAGDNVHLNDIEWMNGAAPNPLISIGTVFALLISGCKTENYNAATSSPTIWSLGQCNARIVSCSINGLLGSAGNPLFINGNASTLSIIGLTCGSSMTGGVPIAYTGATIPFVSDVLLAGGFSDNLRLHLGALPMPKFDADKRQGDWVTEPGNASVTLSAASDRIQYFGTTLTANRTVTLPNTGLYEGMEFEIVRKAATPGAFTLVVTDPVSANNYTFAASTNGFVTYRYRGNWRIMRAGTM